MTYMVLYIMIFIFYLDIDKFMCILCAIYLIWFMSYEAYTQSNQFLL